MALDERALRKPGFTEGYAVALADGQEWSFPRARIRFKPVVTDGRVEVGGGPSFGPEYDRQLDVLFGVADVEPIERLRVQFEMAVRLLRVNYALADDDLAELLALEVEDEASEARWEQITEALMGIAPKPSPAT